MLPFDDHLESFSGASGLNTWCKDEYEAGYGARFAGTAESWTATPCWRAGWQEADRELTASNGYLRSSSVDPNVDLEPMEWSLFGTGNFARDYQLPFDHVRGTAWKRSWIRRDIEVGTVTKRRIDA